MKPCTLLTGLLAASPALAGGGVSITEIRIDQPSSDNDEYFELQGPVGLDLSGMTYLVIGDGTGGSGVIESVTPLTGVIGASGYYVVAESTFTIGTADEIGSLNFENGDNVTHLLVSGFTGANGDDLDTDDDGVLDATPWAAIEDCIALLEEVGAGDLVYCADTVGPDGTFVPGHAFDCPNLGGWQIGLFDPVGGLDTPGADNSCEAPPVYATINEIRIDQPSSDDDEYVELMGTPGDSLDGLTYIVIGDGAGGSGVIEGVADLTGSVIPASGLFVAAESTFTIGSADLITTLDFENSDNVTHLLVRDFTGAKDDDLDTDDDGVLDSTPWSEVVDCVALIEEVGGGDQVYCDTTVGPDGTFVPGHVFLCPDLGGWQIGAFDPVGGDDTPGADNDCSPNGEFTTYCVAFPNSVSVDGATIGWTGSGNLSDNDTVLTVADCPDDWGLFFFGDGEDLQIPFGNGALCVTMPLTRWPVSKAVGNANSYALDFTGSGPEAGFLVGETKYIQYWYRDPGQGAGHNTSDALAVTFGG